MSWFNKITNSKFGLLIIGLLVGLLLSWLFMGPAEVHEHQENAETATAEEPTVWTCSMHPQIQQPNPGDCPICGMDLIPLTSDSGDDDSPRQMSMSTAAKKLAEIQTVSVIRDFADHELRLVGKVEYDETRLRYITAWFPGRLDRLFVDYTGTPVRKGDHLVEIYSPNIITDQEALIQASKAMENLKDSTIPQVLTSKRNMLEKARERLRLLGLTQEQIKEIEELGKPTEQITFYSPIDGIVVHKNLSEGDYVQTGDRIYTIADLSKVWVKMDAYESDLQWLHIGQEVEFTTVAYPGEVFTGRIAFIDPFLNEQTRTVKVRVNVPNPNGKLKPDMFVHANVKAKVTEAGRVFDPDLAGKWIGPMHPEIVKNEPGTCDICGMPLVSAESLGFVNPAEEDLQPPLLIPDSAPLITGKRAVVYVQVPNTERPTYEGREIVLGPRVGDQYVVKEGLIEGEEVVTNGNFNIDSALQIQAKPSMMSPDQGAPKQGPPEELDEKTIVPNDVLAALLQPYQEMWNALASDDLQAAQKASNGWVSAAENNNLTDVAKLGHQVMHAEDISTARGAFRQMSEVIMHSVEVHGAPNEDLYLMFCPMAFDNQGAEWIQWSKETQNPFYGESMLKCGELLKTFEAGTATDSQKKAAIISEDVLAELMPLYMQIQSALAADDLNAAQNAAEIYMKQAKTLENEKLSEFAEKLATSSEIDDARLTFSVLSNIMIRALQQYGSSEEKVYQAYCPMAFQNQGAQWLQKEQEINNPYFGAAMLKCGEIQETFSPQSQQ